MIDKGQLIEEIENCEKLLIGIGNEWKAELVPDHLDLYEKMSKIIGKKDYFIITTVTDGTILTSSLETSKIVAPCGNKTWRQCQKSCTKDIWEQGEIPEDICPHCNSPLIGNTIEAEDYIEEGYLPQWKVYTEWLANTLNKRLLILELGVGFQTPTVIRWPFEKTVSVHKKAKLYRIHETYPQLTEGLQGRAESSSENSVEFFRNL